MKKDKLSESILVNLKESSNVNVSEMAKKIKELDSLDNFYENVRKIVGYYDDNVFIEDWDIKELQRIADARYEELGGLEK